MIRRASGIALPLLVAACASSPPPDLATAVVGMDKARFLRCAGPPIVTLPEGAQERMSFVTNLQRGDALGNRSPTALPPASCSVDAVFQNERVISASFSGNRSMCSLVFSPCLPK